jgi:hypothetical protein
MKKKAVLTFDYEVFLGEKTGSVEKSILAPTRLIIDVLKKNNGKAIFFVDTSWLAFLKVNFPEDFLLVSEQLVEIVNIGSSVELHLHPQWQSAYVTNDGIQFDNKANYRLHSFNDTEISEIFLSSKLLLESITKQQIKCFRAGGYCIEPFNQLKNAFEKAGIKYDFSVVPGMRLKTGGQYDFDFSSAPQSFVYCFENDVLKPVNDGSFVEIPLSTFRNNIFYKVINRVLLNLKQDRFFGDGKGIKKYPESIFNLLIRSLILSKDLLSLDSTSNFFFKFLIKFHFRNSGLLVIISHPKTLSKEGITNLSYIVENFSTLNSSELVDLDEMIDK